MPEHWEFASQKASGQYVLVLTDRSVLKQGALADLHSHLTANPEVDVCSWGWSLYDNRTNTECVVASGTAIRDTGVLKSSFVIGNFMSASRRNPFLLPRGLNSCYKKTYADRIRKEHGALFTNLTPDYSSAFKLLHHTSHILHINQPLFVSQGLETSTGRLAVISDAGKYLETLVNPDPYQCVPVKASFVTNLIYADFLMARQFGPGTLAQFEVDWVQYFIDLYWELLIKHRPGESPTPAINEMHRRWKDGLEKFDKDTQISVRKKLRGAQVRLLLKSSPFGSVFACVRRRLWTSFKPTSTARFQSVLHAAGFYN
jgi:hypothetical protein